MGIRILIVEDEADLADFIVRGLREEGFAVEHAVDGETAWEAMRASEWDLIVLDWRLPGEDGLSVLRRFRGSGGVAPVLFLTARDSDCRPRPRPGRRGGRLPLQTVLVRRTTGSRPRLAPSARAAPRPGARARRRDALTSPPNGRSVRDNRST